MKKTYVSPRLSEPVDVRPLYAEIARQEAQRVARMPDPHRLLEELDRLDRART